MQLNKQLDPRLTVKSVAGLTRAIQQPSSPMPMVMASKSAGASKKMTMVEQKEEAGLEYALKPSAPAAVVMGQVEIAKPIPGGITDSRLALAQNNKSQSYSADAATNSAAASPQADFGTGVNEDAHYESNLKLNYQAQLPDLISAGKDDQQPPQILRFNVFKFELTKYQLNWETNLVTKGQVFVLDSTGNTLQALAEKGQYAYDHQMNIDTSQINTGFLFKLVATYLNGNQAVTITQPLSPTPTP
jgi:hypothetical protein